MCMLAAAIFTRNDSRVSKTSTRQFAERAICTASPDWAGAFAAKRIRFGSCNCAHRCVHSPRGDSPKRSLHLRRIRRLWLNSFGGGVKQKADSVRGQACSKLQYDGGLPNLLSIFGIFQNHRSLRYRTQGVIRYGPFSGAYAAGFVSLAEKSSLKKTLVHFAVTKTPHFA